MKEPAWHYLVSNQYGFNHRISQGKHPMDTVTRGTILNIPVGILSRADIERLCERLAKCGVVYFDMDALYRTQYYPISRSEFSNLMNYIYPCVNKHGVDVFSSPITYRDRNFGQTPVTAGHHAFDRLKATPHDDHFDATASIANIQSILNKETPVSNEAPKFDAQTGAQLPKAYESRILTGEDLKPGVVYRLEVVGGNNPPEVAEPGKLYVAVADAHGEYEGWVRTADGTERTFEVDHRDLFLKQ